MEKCDCEDDVDVSSDIVEVIEDEAMPDKVVDKTDCMAEALALGKIPSRECCAGYMTIPLESHPCKRYGNL
jgi:hypothetical protein